MNAEARKTNDETKKRHEEALDMFSHFYARLKLQDKRKFWKQLSPGTDLNLDELHNQFPYIRKTTLEEARAWKIAYPRGNRRFREQLADKLNLEYPKRRVLVRRRDKH
jgi:hypothetical protein